MSELITAARPYARAAFEVARDGGNLDAWSAQLAFMAVVASDPAMCALLDNPRLTQERTAEMFAEVCAGNVDRQGGNFIRLLAENDRLSLLPHIALLFEEMRAREQGKVEASVVSAQPLAQAQLDAIVARLKARFGREVELVCETDEGLIGGAVIRAGDLVIDGSVRGRLEKLAGNLNR
ncbi:MAG: F0F1 ATP synthase subunit delta [Chromatiales bacterium]|jgi:F-type H+-transporting ATPase subunit delta|nr:F0F1 ATP synthase subunit delta [Chromatiales bacterium]MDX9768178.1 F0F1 ATP synthase subunit delta [Ectothiorhodospiraceae bacterium]